MKPGDVLERRSIALPHQMAVINLPSSPTYQLKFQDESPKGAGIIVRADSMFLTAVAVGQDLNAKLRSPDRSQIVTGDFRAKVADISKFKQGRCKGHFLLGPIVSQETALKKGA